MLDAAKLCFIAKAVRQPRCCQRDKAVCFVALILRETERLVRVLTCASALLTAGLLNRWSSISEAFCCFLQTIQARLRWFFCLRRTTSANPSKGLEDPGVAESLASRAQPEIALQCYLSESKTTLHPKPLKPQPPPPLKTLNPSNPSILQNPVLS